jgi:hypothetical protein
MSFCPSSVWDEVEVLRKLLTAFHILIETRYKRNATSDIRICSLVISASYECQNHKLYFYCLFK